MHNYLNGSDVKLRLNDGIFIDMEILKSGEKYEALEPRRLFPVGRLDEYVIFFDAKGKEVAILRNFAGLDEKSADDLSNCLNEYYMIPRITKFISMSEKFSIWIWKAQTDHGVCTFEIRNHIQAVKPMNGRRVMIKDANDNRYEIPDYNKLDKKSYRMLMPNL